ncbi:hypothetical protein N9917_00055 [Deltaproteobacteria bacterium]|nr:hypothetical protein [Deltaproteobacteria bacterium]
MTGPKTIATPTPRPVRPSSKAGSGCHFRKAVHVDGQWFALWEDYKRRGFVAATWDGRDVSGPVRSRGEALDAMLDAEVA